VPEKNPTACSACAPDTFSTATMSVSVGSKALKPSWDEIHRRKYSYLNEEGDRKTSVSNYTPHVETSGKACSNGAADRLQSLRDTLVSELNALATSACDVPCDEDKELDELMDRYKKHADDLAARTSGGGKSSGAHCATFDNDPTIQLLKAKREQLESFTFAYLHGECEGAHRCNPHTSVIHPSLLACSGLLDGAVLFHDDALADIGREIAGKQARTLSPAANGFAASLFQTDTIAPGLNQSDGEPTYWVNVCFRAPHSDGLMPGHHGFHVKWVPANPLEVAKFQTLRHIDLTIRKHKQRILQVNHQMFTLQRRLRSARAQSAQVYFARPRRGLASDAFEADLTMFVGETADRLKNKLRVRNTDSVPAFVPPALGRGARKAADAAGDADDVEEVARPKSSKAGR
jgi:hypothetical protein